jgi:hypothetical protein
MVPTPFPRKNVAQALAIAYEKYPKQCSEAEENFKKFYGEDFLYVICHRSPPDFKYEITRYARGGFRSFIKDDITVTVSGRAETYYLADKKPPVAPPIP